MENTPSIEKNTRPLYSTPQTKINKKNKIEPAITFAQSSSVQLQPTNSHTRSASTVVTSDLLVVRGPECRRGPSPALHVERKAQLQCFRARNVFYTEMCYSI
ncbi:hypothetical protein O3G_MSEX009244 [Manduca sexta]|uniref:Uncharacterized protein n=1 Tax=Manduca sexta TaxID=7130 RepID=A0A922CRS7_MANSE|nr:hypothetical protein O3G_MSEX009244 [Manduca sexta]KAG6455524.1 hypothetical protein O3G_MSEX009244 [Manduca sexta]KAG6455525.1 hypothetical protein O3G_MSEX009244 [Manduca sexta]KAG6455526.1 hypothetical protein O3G_MSEX009244 [Manduca sexta]